jgi:hypothetical protein
MGPGTNYLYFALIKNRDKNGAWHQLKKWGLAPIIYTLPYLLCLGPVHSPTKVNFQGSF